MQYRLSQPCFIICLAMLIWSFPAEAAELKKHIVVSDGHPLTVWEKTPDNPKAQILLLHGRTWSSLPDFDLQVEGEDLSFMDGLNQLGYSVFALDARGYGATPRDKTGWLTPSRAAKDTITVLHWLTESKLDTHLFGWSYGSMVSQLVAQRNPGLIRSLILFGYPFDPKRHVPDIDKVYPAIAPAEANTKENATSDFITKNSISKRAIDTYVSAALKTDPVRVDFKDLHQWAELDAKKIVSPILLLQGEFDPYAIAAGQDKFFAQISTANKWWIVLEGGDHAALLETPRRKMLTVIDNFIDSLEL